MNFSELFKVINIHCKSFPSIEKPNSTALTWLLQHSYGESKITIKCEYMNLVKLFQIAHLVFREKLIWNIKATMVLVC